MRATIPEKKLEQIHSQVFTSRGQRFSSSTYVWLEKEGGGGVGVLKLQVRRETVGFPSGGVEGWVHVEQVAAVPMLYIQCQTVRDSLVGWS